MKLAIIGAGWSGLSAAVAATKTGHEVTVFETSRTLGGRARAVACQLPNGTSVRLDNGQHILIGAYGDTLAVMVAVGVDPLAALHRLPLSLKFPDGTGVEFPNWPSPLDALGGILGADGWRLADKASLLMAALRWQWHRFTCPGSITVAQLCQSVSPKIMAELIEPLCVSALNTPANRASGQVFLRVMRDSLFGVAGSSNLLLPKTDLSALFPDAAAAWLGSNGAKVRLGANVETLQPNSQASGWLVGNESFDTVILAVSASSAKSLLTGAVDKGAEPFSQQILEWVRVAEALRFESITTVYAFAQGAALPHPMLALRSKLGGSNPAQFVFDRGQLGGLAGLLAFVVSASDGDRQQLEAQVLNQAKLQLGLQLVAVQTIVEKRATFTCAPGLTRPPMHIAPGLFACGDYCEGPYPATLEGAVRSGLAAAAEIASQRIMGASAID